MTAEETLKPITFTLRDCGEGNEYYVYDDLDILMSYRPHKYSHTGPMGITFYEHPVDGEDGCVIAVLDGTAWDCTFYDPWNDCDKGYIAMQAVHLHLLPKDTILWNNTTRSEIAADLRAPIVNLFATHDSFADLEKYIERFSGAERALATVIMGITMNTTLAVMANYIEEQGR